MNFDVAYSGTSGVGGVGVDGSRLGLATNTLRPQGYLRGVLAHSERVRDVLGTLHGVVVSDLRKKVRDRAAWQAWLAQKDRAFLLGVQSNGASAREALERVEHRLDELNARREQRRAPFYEARQRYANYVVKHSSELMWLYDPVVTVHPDEVFFEAFSKDESSYARVGLDRSLLRDEGDVVLGTTNIDFSPGLARHLERLRGYRTTTLAIGPGGVDVGITQAGIGEKVHREAKIPLPESWVNGFLQVQATMTLGLTSLTLRPIDLANVLRVLVQKKARTSPKALRFELVPGQRVKIVLEPWEISVETTTIYRGDSPQVIRLWGRDRLKLLARLLPHANEVRVELAGFGLPSFWVVDLGGVSFTLGLSGWTDNDWTGEAQKSKGNADARFELLTRRVDATPEEVMRVYDALRAVRVTDAAALVSTTELGIETVRGALSTLAQAGRATFDLRLRQYRHRDLFADTFTLADARRITKARIVEDASPAAKNARRIFDSDGVRVIATRPIESAYKVSGSVRGLDGRQLRPLLHVDGEGLVLGGTCTCPFFNAHQMTRGPCEHVLALRLAHMSRVQ
jgi:hypothetical protein